MTLLGLTLLAAGACGGDATTPLEFLDSDFDGILDDVDQCPFQPETFNNVFDSDGCPDQSVDLYNAVRADVEAFWPTQFGSGASAYRTISTFQPYTTPFSTPCGVLQLQNAFYCGLTQGVYYDANFLDTFLARGDMAPAFIIAHEIGHHVSNLLDFERPIQSGKQIELQADCFAGAWTRNVETRGFLEAGDLDEVVEALIRVGDPANTWFNPNEHGTPEQRIEAFAFGYRLGRNGCVSLEFLRSIPSPALSFNDGTSTPQYVEVPDHADLDLSNRWTIEAWVFPDTASQSGQVLLSKGWHDSVNGAYVLARAADGRLFVATASGTPWSIVFSNRVVAGGGWHHIAVSFENGTLRIYIDGVLDTIQSGVLTPQNSFLPLLFGDVTSFGARFPSPMGGAFVLDEIRVWNVVRSQSELAASIDALLVPTPPGLVGHWRLNSGLQDIAYDATERGHNGRLGSRVGPDANDPVWEVGAPLPAPRR